MLAALLAAVLVVAQAADAAPIVCEDVDLIAVCHVSDGSELVYFFGFAQGEWTCLDHRWLAADMAPGFDGERFTLAWHDDCDSCYRVVRAAHWIESREAENPRFAENNKPWHARGRAPGLKPPK